MQAIFETLFDILYLTTVITLGVRMIRVSARKNQVQIQFQIQYCLFGIMAVVLGCGDAFHLIPRAIALCTTGLSNYTAALGIGKLITSITMTLFYFLLYLIWRCRYQIKYQAETARKNKAITILVWLLSICRIVLCLFPQNNWTSTHPPLSWGIYRNIPFVILGALITILFYRSTKEKQDRAFRFLWLAIVLSFACYIPVVLFSDSIPAVGMLMIPKTCAYVWMVLIGYCAMKQDYQRLTAYQY